MKFLCIIFFFCPSFLPVENSMHEVVYSPTTHEHFWGEETIDSYIRDMDRLQAIRIKQTVHNEQVLVLFTHIIYVPRARR